MEPSIKVKPRGPGRPKVTPEYLAEKSQPAPKTKKPSELDQAFHIHQRFFKAFRYLIETKEIQSPYAFSKEHNINPSNFYQLEKSPEQFRLPVAYLSFLVVSHGVNGNWLLSGEGNMMQ